MMYFIPSIAGLILLTLTFSCKKGNPSPVETPNAKEVSVHQIYLTGDASIQNAEMSGLTWHNNNLILMPQNPRIYTNQAGTGKFFKLSKTLINNYINGSFTSLEPYPILVHNIPQSIEGFEGFEAIAMKENTVYLIIEVQKDSSMIGYLIKGTINDSTTEISLDTTTLTQIETPVFVTNAAYESIVITHNCILCIYEGNGKNINPTPIVKVFDFNFNSLTSISFPSIEYRITDATVLASDNTFYVINYFYPGDSISYIPSTDEYSATFGLPGSHNNDARKERLIKLKYTSSSIQKVDTPPVYLELTTNNWSRNWEGIEQLSDKTFLIITDYFPGTVFGYLSLE